MRKCTNCRGISLISVQGKVYAKCLEKKCREIVEPKLTDAQCGFRPVRSTMDQIFSLQQIFEKSWEYAKEVNAYFVDLEKAYDRIPRDKLWAVLLWYGIDGQLLTAIKQRWAFRILKRKALVAQLLHVRKLRSALTNYF